MSLQKLLVPFLLMVFFTTPMIAQLPSGNGVTLSGAAQDAQTKKALAFLSIVLKTEKDSAFVAGTLTDEAGSFTALLPNQVFRTGSKNKNKGRINIENAKRLVTMS